MKTLAVFAHYDYDNEVKEYVIYYLTQLKLICDEIIFVSTSELKEKECSQISSICSEIITRGNKGHDFYSYKVGLDYIGDLSPYEQVILCNDSCIGPLFDLEAYFNNMNELDVDFWGVSACARPFLHIQSYFLVFNRTVINSIVFKDFWQQVNVLNNKDEIVMNYEVGLSQKLLNADFQWSTIVPHKEYKLSACSLLQRKLAIYIQEYKFSNSRFSWKINQLVYLIILLNIIKCHLLRNHY